MRTPQFTLFNLLTLFLLTAISSTVALAEETRLLRQPTISKDHVSFVYGGDLWIADLNGSNVKRLTNSAALESNPHFSPDGKTIAFSSNRSGSNSVYTISIDGGQPKRLTYHASGAQVRGWTNDGKRVLFASGRDTAPRPVNRLWTIALDGSPAELVNKQWAFNGSFSPNGKQIVIDRMGRWDVEWRNYRGGQNTPLVVLNLANNKETKLPFENSVDIEPVWVKDKIYFISDRDWIANVWSYEPKSKALEQITFFDNSDVKQLGSNGELLVIEHNGYVYTINPKNKQQTRLKIEVKGDFPWADVEWKDVTDSVRSAGLSPTGKRAVMQARGEIFTVPVENGSVRNLSQSSGEADRKPIWSPKGGKIAWFTDAGAKGYKLVLANQDGSGKRRYIDIGESKMAWSPTFSPDGKYIAFVDDDVRIRVVDLAKGSIKTIDSGGSNLERGRNGLTWSPDSSWLAYSKTASNNFRQIWAWSMKSGKTTAITNRFADSFSPSWDKSGKHMYFLASTDLGLNSGWANTSNMTADSEYAAYVINLKADEASPFAQKSDEEEVKSDSEEDDADKEDKKEDKDDKKSDKKSDKDAKDASVTIDFKNIDRRVLALSTPAANYVATLTGPKGSVFILERKSGSRGLTIHKFVLEDNKATEFASGVTSPSMSSDGKHMLVRAGSSWKLLNPSKPSDKKGKRLKVKLEMKLDRQQEWAQIFDEAYRYQRDYFYDPDLHGRDWDDVYKRYSPLVPHIKHRADLNYVVDMVNGELSVGHSFVFGGDFPDVPRSKAGLLGADLEINKKRWQIKRIFTSESWNPSLNGPLDEPGLDVADGDYIVGVNGKEIDASDNIYKYLEGTVGKQITLHVNKKPKFKGAREIVVVPTRSERGLRQRAWVEDNRRLVDKLSDGKLAYIWVPDTSFSGFTSFTRYFFAQQDKLGAVVDDRFNGGGLLDDYMVDLMSREVRAALTNEVPNGKPFLLPAGIKGPKVLLVNELAGSGGDFFPWVFKRQNIGPLVGETTWGGLVKSSVHYSLVDGGALTAPDNAVFDPINNEWVGENVGIPPDIFVYQDAVALNKGRDPQLERAVREALNMLKKQNNKPVTPPPFPKPAKKK